MSWRAGLVRQVGWSLGAASLWTWGLLAVRMLRDGLLPLEVWFGYSFSFFMTAVYVYMGLLIYATIRTESRRTQPAAPTAEGHEPTPCSAGWPARLYPAAGALGLAGLAVALTSLVGWLVLKYPGPQAASGTVGSLILALMILAVVGIATVIARGAR